MTDPFLPRPDDSATPPDDPRPERSRARRRLLAVALPLVVLAAAVVGFQLTRDDGSEAQTTAPDESAPPPPSIAPPTTAPPAQTSWVIATSQVPEIQAYDSPSEAGAVVTTLSDTTDYGLVRTFLVVDQQPEWLEVLLPVRPNGSTGWVRAADVATSTTAYKVTIELAAHKVTLYESGAPVVETPAVIGKAETPTPLGMFFVTDPVDLRDDPNGAYGAFAFGLSGYSDVLFEFAGGPGQIALHGTNRPDQVGQDISNGCIRIPNDIVLQLVDRLPLGTPVEILA